MMEIYPGKVKKLLKAFFTRPAETTPELRQKVEQDQGDGGRQGDGDARGTGLFLCDSNFLITLTSYRWQSFLRAPPID
jgi:hypothetical protein